MRDGSASLACALACEVLVVALLIPSRKAHAILYIERGQGSIDDSRDSVEDLIQRRIDS